MRIGNLMICLWTPCLLLAGIGCSDGGPVLVPVKGKVTVGSGQPFAKGTVRFTPMDLNQGQGAYAITDEMGNYELIHFSQKPGIATPATRFLSPCFSMKTEVRFRNRT